MLHSHDFQNAELWPADALAHFSAAYPAKPAPFKHQLTGHPLMDRAMLADAAVRLPASHVEWRKASNGAGFIPTVPDAQTLKSIFAGKVPGASWLMLRGLEELPDYRALIDEILAPVAQVSAAHTGKLHQPRAFLFLSTAGAITPFHFDPEHNILFHLDGPKNFHLCEARPPHLNDADHFRLHRTGDNLLVLPTQAEGTTFQMSAGDALYVPYKWPHHVQVGDAPALSLSITWTSDWSLARDAAWRGEAVLRRLGLPTLPLPDWPAKTPVRSLIGRAASRFT